MGKIKLSKPANFGPIIEELWEASPFDPDVLEVIEALTPLLTADNPDYEQIESHPMWKEAYYRLTTTRNKNLINSMQQNLLRQTVVGFFGLSVGSHAAITWMLGSRANHIKVSDPDTISPSNLNRLRYSWGDIGRKKTEVVTRELLKINPYVQVEAVNDTNHKIVEKLFTTKPKLNIVVDAIDDLKGKVKLRQLCREQKIPLVSAADVGDNVMLDIERYDLKPTPKMFHNRVPEIESLDLDNLTPIERKNIIIRIVGFEHNSISMLDSLNNIGKQISTWPQLGATATIAGGVVATTIKKIVLGEDVKSGRYYISLDDLLVANFNSQSSNKSREKIIKKILEN